jgi:tetratricopeptide (TPR) repeat protein
MRSILPVIFLLVTLTSAAQSSNKKEDALKLARQAVKIMDEGETNQAIMLLDSAKRMDPTNYVYDYETGYAYMLKKDRKNAIFFFEASTKYESTDAQCYQMLGNAYDEAGNKDKAIAAYAAGLEKFPNAGRLYMEWGIIEANGGNRGEALKKWEKGIIAEPTYASNYVRLADLFSETDHRIWSIFYGEMFMNIERNSERTTRMSELLFKMYKQSITIVSDKEAKVDFTDSKITMVDPSKKFQLPFRMVYGLDFLVGIGFNSVEKKNKEVTLEYIVNARTAFIDWWFKQKRNKDYPNILLSFQKELRDKGYLEAYNYWLFMKGDEDAFQKWYDANTDKYKEFVEWFAKNPLKVDEKNFFIRPED